MRKARPQGTRISSFTEQAVRCQDGPGQFTTESCHSFRPLAVLLPRATCANSTALQAAVQVRRTPLTLSSSSRHEGPDSVLRALWGCDNFKHSLSLSLSLSARIDARSSTNPRTAIRTRISRSLFLLGMGGVRSPHGPYHPCRAMWVSARRK